MTVDLGRHRFYLFVHINGGIIVEKCHGLLGKRAGLLADLTHGLERVDGCVWVLDFGARTFHDFPVDIDHHSFDRALCNI